MRAICSLVLLGCIVLVSCGPPPTSGPDTPRTVEPNGPTANLKRSEGEPLYYLDRVGDVVSPLTRPSLTVSLLGNLTASGWAVDQQSQAEAGGVDVAIDGKPYRAQYGLDRPDVADYFKVPAYAKSGYTITIPAIAVGRGKHQLAVRVISKDGTTYREGSRLVIEVQ
jgi:hypothetical protein